MGSFFVGSSSGRRLTIIPAVKAVINAAIGLMIVMTGSSRAYVMEIESTPVSGVDIMNAVVAPLLAPCFRRPIETGTTPQEHMGSGMPISDALSTEVILFFPRCFSTNS